MLKSVEQRLAQSGKPIRMPILILTEILEILVYIAACENYVLSFQQKINPLRQKCHIILELSSFWKIVIPRDVIRIPNWLVKFIMIYSSTYKFIIVLFFFYNLIASFGSSSSSSTFTLEPDFSSL